MKIFEKNKVVIPKAVISESIKIIVRTTHSRKLRIKTLSTQRKIIDFLKFNFVAKRNDIVKALSIPRTTIYDNLVKLKKLKIVDNTRIKFNSEKGASFRIWFLTSDMKQITDKLERLL